MGDIAEERKPSHDHVDTLKQQSGLGGNNVSLTS
jgi:hypothetical protein